MRGVTGGGLNWMENKEDGKKTDHHGDIGGHLPNDMRDVYEVLVGRIIRDYWMAVGLAGNGLRWN